jgi:hypothetical protein
MCFVIHGITRYAGRRLLESRSQYVGRLEAAGSEQLILASMAGHVQFVGKKLHQFRQNPMTVSQLENVAFLSAYHQMVADRSFALVEGCTLAEPHLLVVRHIYCDQLCNQSDIAEFVYDFACPINERVLV